LCTLFSVEYWQDISKESNLNTTNSSLILVASLIGIKVATIALWPHWWPKSLYRACLVPTICECCKCCKNLLHWQIIKLLRCSQVSLSLLLLLLLLLLFLLCPKFVYASRQLRNAEKHPQNISHEVKQTKPTYYKINFTTPPNCKIGGGEWHSGESMLDQEHATISGGNRSDRRVRLATRFN